MVIRFRILFVVLISILEIIKEFWVRSLVSEINIKKSFEIIKLGSKNVVNNLNIYILNIIYKNFDVFVFYIDGV